MSEYKRDLFDDKYRGCPSDQHPGWSRSPVTRCDYCTKQNINHPDCHECKFEWGKGGTVELWCKACKMYDRGRCNTHEGYCTNPPPKNLSINLQNKTIECTSEDGHETICLLDEDTLRLLVKNNESKERNTKL